MRYKAISSHTPLHNDVQQLDPTPRMPKTQFPGAGIRAGGRRAIYLCLRGPNTPIGQMRYLRLRALLRGGIISASYIDKIPDSEWLIGSDWVGEQ